MGNTEKIQNPESTAELEIFKIIEHNDETLIDTVWQKTNDTLKCIAPGKSIYLHGYMVPVNVIMEGVLKLKPFVMLD